MKGIFPIIAICVLGFMTASGTFPNQLPGVESNITSEETVSGLVKPSFPGGDQALMKFIDSNIEYPNEALVNEIEGRLIAQFTINEDGSTANHKVLVGLGAGCGHEALRVLQKMPKWNPATLNGAPLKFDFTIPILFKIDHPRPMKKKRRP